MMKRKNTIKMKMRSAVLYTASQINNGKTGMFVSTEFGKIGVEINSQSQIDPFHPVDILLWEQAPDTRFTHNNRNIDADYYLSINIFDDPVMDHMAIIEGISRCMLYNVGITDPPENAIQAMIISYIIHYDESVVTVNQLVNEYVNTHMNFAIRSFNSVQTVIREMFQQKIEAGKDVIEMGLELLQIYNMTNLTPDDYFIDEYSKEVFGILLFCHMKQKKSLDGILNNIIAFQRRDKAINQSLIAVNK